MHERRLTHFQREHRNRNLALDGRVLRDVQHERRLSHRRTGGDDHQIRRLEARRQLVEIVESARHAGDRLTAALQRFDALHRRPEQFLDANESVVDPLLADLEDFRFRFVEQLDGVGAALEGLLNDGGRDFDQASEKRLLSDDLRVVLDVRGRRDGVDEEADVLLAARRLEIPAPRELVRQRDRIHHPAALGDADHRAKETPMLFGVE